MTPWKFMIVSATTSALGLAIACSSPNSTKPALNVGDSGSDCERLFDAIFVKCPEQLLPGEIGHLRQRFGQQCQNTLALPGVSLTGATLRACINAYETAGCNSDAVATECSKPGTLAPGAPCNIGEQCQSNSCYMGPGMIPDGGSPTPRCGTCAATATIPVGQPCGAGQGPCASGSVCAGANPTCVAFIYGDVGASCGSEANACKSGLACDFATYQCATILAAGAPCTQASSCYPLVCVGRPPNQSCQSPQQARAPCSASAECAWGLTCDPSSGQCQTIRWVSGGQPCDVGRCAVGTCYAGEGANGSTTPHCPVVIADNQPCNNGDQSTICDTFASCTNGTCALPGGTVCK